MWVICTAWTEAEVCSWTVQLEGRVSERNVRAQRAGESGKVYTARTPQVLEPFLLLQAPSAIQHCPFGVGLENEVSQLFSSVAGCTPCTLLFFHLSTGTSRPLPWHCFKAQTRCLSQHKQFLLYRWPGTAQHMDSRQHVSFFIWVPDT